MASPAWLPQESQPPVSGETPLPMASSAHTTPSTGKPTAPLRFLYDFNSSNVIPTESVKVTAHAKLFNATAFVAPAPAPPFAYGMLQNVNASGSSQQSSTHPVSIVPSYLFVVLGLW